MQTEKLPLRVGVITNTFPPFVVGGYEIGCEQVVEGLRDQGLDVQVLTSTPCLPEGRPFVHNWLSTSLGAQIERMSPLEKLSFLVRHEHHNISTLKRFIHTVRPDVLYFWNLCNTSHAMVPVANKSGVPIGSYIFDEGLGAAILDAWTFQAKHVPGSRLRAIQRIFLHLCGLFLWRPRISKFNFNFAQYPTDYLREKLQNIHVTAARWEHIPWGVDTDAFNPQKNVPSGQLLYVGQVTDHKGVHVAIESLALIKRLSPAIKTRLTVAGKCLDPVYERRLADLVKKHGLEFEVDFIGFVGRDDLPALYQNHSILIFPSTWEEPMGITILEAMASGLCVVSSGTGGSWELFESGTSGVLFRNGDASDLADKLQRLVSDHAAVARIGAAARKYAEQHYRFADTVTAIRSSLEQAAQRKDSLQSQKC
jgi:glycosyltransferase involved in cell wall biosynthesis